MITEFTINGAPLPTLIGVMGRGSLGIRAVSAKGAMHFLLFQHEGVDRYPVFGIGFSSPADIMNLQKYLDVMIEEMTKDDSEG